jgi:hypothetical protein
MPIERRVVCNLFAPTLFPHHGIPSGRYSSLGFVAAFYINVKVLIDTQVPLGVAAAVVQASLYDVPGGYKAVMFDRFSGVKDKVRWTIL